MKQKVDIIKLGGIALIISGMLFFAQYLFTMPMPDPPPADGDLLAWLQQ